MNIEKINWPAQWDIGSSKLKTSFDLNKEELLLTYNVAPIDKKKIGKKATIVLLGVQSFRFSKMRYDLEALKKHKYYCKGVEHYEAHIIHNSDWLEEYLSINQATSHIKLTHYLLSFKDEMLEVIAKDFYLKKRKKPLFFSGTSSDF